MRLHMYDNPFTGWETTKIFLNGNRVPHCYYADEEAGYVDVFVADDEGRPIIDPFTRDVVRARHFGEVLIAFSPPNLRLTIDEQRAVANAAYAESDRILMDQGVQ